MPAIDIASEPARARPAGASMGRVAPTYYMVTIDTEEEWDWGAGWPIEQLRVSNIRVLCRPVDLGVELASGGRSYEAEDASVGGK